jgi:hypothetical protein
MLCARTSIYLDGFGVEAPEAAEEIVTVNLLKTVEEYLRTGVGALEPSHLREILIRFLTRYQPTRFSGSQSDIAFTLSFTIERGIARWQVGRLGNAPGQVIVVGS